MEYVPPIRVYLAGFFALAVISAVAIAPSLFAPALGKPANSHSSVTSSPCALSTFAPEKV